MATIRGLTIPNGQVNDVLEAVEQVWKGDAVRLTGSQAQYDQLTAPDKIRACLVAEVRVRTRNSLREKAERAVPTPPEPDVT